MKISSRAWRPALSVASGFVLALAFPNYNLPLLGWVSVAGLLYASVGAAAGEGALCGFLYGAAYYGLSVPWIYTVVQQYGPLPVWEASGVFALFVGAMSVFSTIFAAVTAWIARRSVPLALIASPFVWVAMDLAKNAFPAPNVCFPWDILGYTAAGNLALLQITSITGIWGLSLLVAAYNALLVWPLRAAAGKPRRRAIATLASVTVILMAVSFLGRHLLPQIRADHVAHLVQTDLPQALDYPQNWDALHAADMAQLDDISISAGLSASSADQPSLIVWPEVPAPFSLQQPAFAQRAIRIAQAGHSEFLVGELDWKPTSPGHLTPYNSAALLDPAGQEGFLYDKIRLVPFGEFFPWRNFFWFAKDLTGLIGDFGVGARYAVGDLPGGKFGVFICYEAIYPATVRQFVLNGAQLLINISNDGWFGRSAAAAQHRNMARVRAVENRRWLLRDTNNGYTISVDPYGRIVASLPADIRGELDAPYAFRTDRTLYTQWGDWLPWLSVIASLCFMFAAAFRSRPAGAKQNIGKRNAHKRKGRKE